MGALKIYTGSAWETIVGAGGGGGSIQPKTIYIEYPTATDAFPLFTIENASTISSVHCVTDTGTVQYNLQHRTKAAPFTTTTTEVFTTYDTASSTASEETTFGDATMVADTALWYVAEAVTGAPTKLQIVIEYSED